ncbi:MAG: hypothetical protein IAE89_07105 [Anaerolineae bacterium]|nr:hypothetical protein [Anaerolineae bacterium]
MRFTSLLLSFALFAFATGIYAQETTPEAALVERHADAAYAWIEANLGLLVPAGWTAETGSHDGILTLSLRPPEDSANAFFTIIVTPAAAFPPAQLDILDQVLAERNLTGYSVSNTGWFGDNALAINPHGTLNGAAVQGRVGRLPDHRIVYALGTTPDFMPIIHHITLDDVYMPEVMTYSLTWSVSSPEFGVVYDTLQPRIAGTAASADRVFAVTQQGVIELDFNGGLIGAYPFLNPSTPTGIALGSDGNIYVGDIVCRCLQVLGANRRWAEPVGSFGANAPASVFSMPSGAIYAVDRSDDAYFLRAVTGERAQTLPLNFNATASPFAGASDSEIVVVEWLQSFIDDSVAGAVSVLDDRALLPDLRFWLPYSPGQVTAITINPEGWLAIALQDGTLIRADIDGTLTPLADGLTGLSSLNFAPSGDLVIGREDGSIGLISSSAPPDRTGSITIVPFAPVQGRLSTHMPEQRWQFVGEAGQVITLAATDLMRRDVLDMRLRLTAPSGAVIAENDDQQGIALWGDYDSYISSVTLPESGLYTVDVDRISGDGTYTLALTVDRNLAMEDQAITLTGALSDVIPIDRWVFQGQRGQIITVTLRAESGDLDPMLTILLSDGRPLARNDDAADPELNRNSQLFRIELPRDGTYILEASRFNFTGAGNYSMVVFSG